MVKLIMHPAVLLKPQLIKATVNAAHLGNASMVVVPQLDYSMMKSTNWEQAADNFKQQQYNKGNFNMLIAEETINWLKHNH